jgi:dihydroflavonol-4-reductase
VRSASPRENLAGLGLDIVEGDLRDGASVRRAMEGVRFAFNVAADYRLWAPDPEEIVRNNRLAADNVVEAALACRIERLVHTSSVATLLPLDGRPSDEDHPATEQTVVGAYKRSKVVAERLIEQAVATRGLPAVIVNPSTPIGPRDLRPTPTGRVIVEAANGRMPAYVDSGLNLVHVEDVAAGAPRRAGKGREQAALCAGRTGRDAGRDAARDRPPDGPPPAARGPAARAAVPDGLGQRKALRAYGPRTVPDRRFAAPGHHMYYSSARAQAELGYSYRPWQAAVPMRWPILPRAGRSGPGRGAACPTGFRMILTLLALISLVIWLGLIWPWPVLDGRRPRRPPPRPEPAQWPDVVAVVPARDEAEVIARSVASLAAQDYPGDFRVIVVDDGSSDGTAELARQAGGSRVQVLAGAPLPAGWTGKIWAQSHGIAAAGTRATSG